MRDPDSLDRRAMLFVSAILLSLLITLILVSSCSLFEESYSIDAGGNIRFVFDEGLNDDPDLRLPKDENGFYSLTLVDRGQTIQRISVILLDGDNVIYHPLHGSKHSLEWRSNLYWWIMRDDTVAMITRTYFNPFTGEIQYVNLPPLINWQDALVPTINFVSLTDDRTGRASTVIAPIAEMRGDTMTVHVSFDYTITRRKNENTAYEVLGSRAIRDSVKIVLR